MPTIGVEKLAKALKVSSRTVRILAEKGIVERLGHGRYDLTKSVLRVAQTNAQKFERAIEEQKITDGQSIPGVTFQRERRLRIQADRDEERLRRERGESMPVETFRAEITQAFRQVRDRLLALPSEIAPQLDGESSTVIKAKLDLSFKSVLASLADGHGHDGAPPSTPGDGPPRTP